MYPLKVGYIQQYLNVANATAPETCGDCYTVKLTRYRRTESEERREYDSTAVKAVWHPICSEFQFYGLARSVKTCGMPNLYIMPSTVGLDGVVRRL